LGTIQACLSSHEFETNTQKEAQQLHGTCPKVAKVKNIATQRKAETGLLCVYFLIGTDKC
jgi:4-hydroxy-3-methylbut-2-enyl diphosphate reductase IspH